ncbi:extracellular solute-binding protein [uncultured Robinsoniella sp.]|uniref:extracellular solute-binding protein n=1 Tax=uncultured Robinsoniella sp. TaxID=904190 RepID=UPI00374F9F78
MANIKDVAKQSGVSIATVSNYINNKKKVGEDTAARIDAAIRNLNYVVHNSGRELRMQKNNDIGIVFPNISDPYLEKIISSIKGYLSQFNRNFVLELSDNNTEKETKAVLNLIGRNVSGIILYSCQPENLSIFEKLERSRIPYVLIDHRPQGFDCNFISVDYRELFYKLTKAVLNKGFRKISMVLGPYEFDENRMAVKGYEEVFKEKGIPQVENNIISTTAIRECGFRAGIQLFEDPELIPDIIFTTSYRLAEGIRYAMKIYHIDERKHISIITTGDAVDDVFYYDTTIIKTSRSAYNMGEAAGKLLLKNIKSPIVFEKEELSFQDSFNLKEIKDCQGSAEENRKLEFQDEICILLLDDESSVSGLSKLLIDFYAKEKINVRIKKVLPEKAFEYICDYFESGRDDIDVILFDLPWLSYFADKGYLICLDEMMTDSDFHTESYLTGTLKNYSMFKNRHYALPYMACTQLLFYRKSLFQSESLARDLDKRFMVPLKIPRTWFQFNTLAKFFTKSYNPDSPVLYGHTMSISYPEQLVCELMPRIWDYDGDLYNSQNGIIMKTHAIKKGLCNLLEAVRYSTPEFLSDRPCDTVQHFVAGESAMLCTFYNYATGIVERSNSSIINDFGYASLPGTSVMAGWCLGITRNSKKAEHAFKFIKWASGAEIAIPHTILGGQSPNMSVYRNYDMVSLYPWLPKALREFEKSKKRLTPTGADGKIISEKSVEDKIYKYMLPMLKKLETGGIPDKDEIQEMMIRMQRDMNRLFV